MGTWAQRSRRGGGAEPTTELIHLVHAELNGASQIIAEWNDEIAVADFGPGDFLATPTFEFNNGATQLSARELLLGFDNQITAAHTLTYSGTAPGVLTPNAIPLT